MIQALETPKNTAILHRPRVYELYEKAMEQDLVLVTAGAGYGKTRATRMYLEHSGDAVVWIQLTTLDNVKTRFWENFVRVAQPHNSSYAEVMRELGFPDTHYQFDQFLQLLSKGLGASERNLVLVIDDVHLIEDVAVRRFVQNLVDVRLEGMRVVLISRHLPSYELPDRTAFIRAEHLRFTKEETEAYLRLCGIEPTPIELDQIDEFVEGWPLALYLTALSILEEGIEHTIGPNQTNHLIFYLIDRDVFSRFSDREQQLMIELSLLQTHPLGLILEVTGNREEEIQNIMRASFFITCDMSSQRYYLHNLFVRFLRARQYKLPEGRANQVYQRAADWCYHNGKLHDALYYMGKCGDHEGIWKVIGTFKQGRHAASEAEKVITYIENFPEEFVKANPMTRVIYAALLLNNGELGRARLAIEEVIHSAEQLEDPDDRAAELLGEAYLIGALILLADSDPGFYRHLKKAHHLLPHGSKRFGRDLNLVEHGHALFMENTNAGSVEKGLVLLEKAEPLFVSLLHGSGAGRHDLAEAEAAYYCGDSKKAIQRCFEAIYVGQSKQQCDVVGGALFLLLRIYFLAGDYKHIYAVVMEIEKAERDVRFRHKGILDIAMGWFYLEIGQMDRVPDWVMNQGVNPHAPIGTQREGLLRLKCLLSQERYYAALGFSNQLEQESRLRKKWISLLYTKIYQSIIHYQLGDLDSAVKTLFAAYDLARGNNWTIPFVEQGKRIRALLDNVKRMDQDHIPQEWLDNIYGKVTTNIKRTNFVVSQFLKDADMGTPNATHNVVELSHREKELLRDLSQGLTREQIAESMGISINTVKSMLRNVYSKLGASNSADAIRIALNLGLV